MILHQILSNKPQTLTDLASIIGAEDAVLLAGDGCYQIGNQELTAITLNIFARTQDVECRGLTNLAQRIGLGLINDAEWLNLTLQFKKVVSWK
jgi:tRNA 2-thiouridine synthesizing protein B|tara:strand:- start:1824 stop:2102 length:279 start_codon:yes stop_codon:yes gene_type:complete